MKKSKHYYLRFLIAGLIAFSFIGLPKDKPYVFEPVFNFTAMPVSADNPVTENGVKLGRYLFYDPILSNDSSFSCATCHQQKNAFSDSPHPFSKGINGVLQSRNTLPLFNLAWYKAFFWDGRAASIEAQVFHPLLNPNELNITTNELVKRLQRSTFYPALFENAFGTPQIDSSRIAKAIAQFERTLISHNSRYDRTLRKTAKLNMDEIEGMELVNDMTKGNCLHCHSTDENGLGTTGQFSNNGLDAVANINLFKDKGLGGFTQQAVDMGKFKIPSFRNLLFTAPYMHDGRFQTLEEVLDFYSTGLHMSPTIDTKMEFVHRGGSPLTKAEKRKIVAFLKTMSDSSFISNASFSNPFRNQKLSTK